MLTYYQRCSCYNKEDILDFLYKTHRKNRTTIMQSQIRIEGKRERCITRNIVSKAHAHILDIKWNLWWTS
uniref:Uncharacterized protein n=1 Tax=Anguilla anguilla TaxID=7936 RepID=A0A0E9VYR9_ANGAN